MYFSIKLFRLYLIFAQFYTFNKAQEDNQISSLFTDNTFVNDDTCSDIINEHSCVKNVLGVLVNFINSNLQKINELDKKLSFLQLENNLQEKKLVKMKKKINKLEFQQQPKETIHRPKSSPINDILFSFLETFDQSYMKINNYPVSKMDNISLVNTKVYFYKTKLLNFKNYQVNMGYVIEDN